jgi:hypothetical protein
MSSYNNINKITKTELTVKIILYCIVALFLGVLGFILYKVITSYRVPLSNLENTRYILMDKTYEGDSKTQKSSKSLPAVLSNEYSMLFKLKLGNTTTNFNKQKQYKIFSRGDEDNYDLQLSIKPYYQFSNNTLELKFKMQNPNPNPNLDLNNEIEDNVSSETNNVTDEDSDGFIDTININENMKSNIEEPFKNTNNFSEISSNEVNLTNLYNESFFDAINHKLLKKETFLTSPEETYKNLMKTISDSIETGYKNDKKELNTDSKFIKEKIIKFGDLFCNFINYLKEDKYNIKETLNKEVQTFFSDFDKLSADKYDLIKIMETIIPKTDNNENDPFYTLINSILEDNIEMFTILSYFKELETKNKNLLTSIISKNDFFLEFNIKMQENDCPYLKLDAKNENGLYKQIIDNIKMNIKKIFYNVGTELKTDINDTNFKEYDEVLINKINTNINVHIGITVKNNVVDIYKDGLLLISNLLIGTPENSNEPFTFFPDEGFNGFLGPFHYYDRPLNQETMLSEYSQMVLKDTYKKVI